MMNDRHIFSFSMMADLNWQVAPLPLKLAVLVFSRRQTVHHEGYRCRIGWLWGVAYLLGVSKER